MVLGGYIALGEDIGDGSGVVYLYCDAVMGERRGAVKKLAGGLGEGGVSDDVKGTSSF
jgi:hypothetical protein